MAAWLGHSAAVAEQHYLKVRPEDFARATEAAEDPARRAAQNPAHNPAQQRPAGACGGVQAETGEAQEPAICGPLHALAGECKLFADQQIAPTGFEPVLSA